MLHRKAIRSTAGPVASSTARHVAKNMPRAVTAALATRANPNGKMVNRGKVELVAHKQHVAPAELIKVLERQGFTVN